jgi:release factor glutamine methyltransferase
VGPNKLTIADLLERTRKYFSDKGIETARLDAELLLADALGVNRVYLYTHYDKPLNDAECDAYRERVRRRGRREPVAYILGQREFFGRMFAVR